MLRIIFLIIILSLNFSRSNVDCENTYRITESYFNENIVGYYIAAFDLATGTSNVLMFDYMIDSTNPSECYLPGDNIELSIDFSVEVQIPEAGIQSYSRLSSGLIKINNILGPMNFRNTDLNLSTSSIGSANVEVEDFKIDKDLNIEQLSSIVLQSGKIPNGSYKFVFNLLNSEGSYIDGTSRIIDVYQPSYLELVSPGGEVSDTLETAIFTSLPVFSWNSDFCSSCNYGVRVSEYNPRDHSSLSEAINDVSVLPLDQSQDFYYPYSSGRNNVNVIPYPVTNAADLEMGKLYAWQVKRVYETTIGESSDFSPVFVFKLVSPDEIASIVSNEIDVLELIKELVGESKYNQLFGAGGQLEGYFVYSMTLNGNEVDEEGLRPITKDISDGKRAILETKISSE
ncbi:MAG: hypothetical protein CMG00_03355 [Candidatus Marinimicrobia bacterium]|nr:hypothetical protein [Candidatus Neomarinimicrobiota bacterium]|tara:strand:- start:3272 stop:4468 length:1197 start_codon:yes stop_codon:yes gene_type:complete